MLTRGGIETDVALMTVSLDWMGAPMEMVDMEVCHRVSLAKGVIIRAGHGSKM